MTSDTDCLESEPTKRTDAPWELLVCVNQRLNPRRPSCGARGAQALAEQFEAALAHRCAELVVTRIYCLGACEQGPNVRLAPGGRYWRAVGTDDIERIVREVCAEIAT